MTSQLLTIELTAEQKAQVFGILSVGCDRETAADYIGCSLADLRGAMQNNSSFAAEVRRAEARVELAHMQNVQVSAKEKKEWRASVWWLERRSPERFGRRSPGAVTARQLKAFVAILADVLREDVQNADDQQRVAARLRWLAEAVDKMLRDDSLGATTSTGDADPPIPDEAIGESDDSFAHVWNDSLSDLG